MQPLTSPEAIFQQRCQDNWIVGLNYPAWLERIQQRQQSLQQWTGTYPRILLVQSDPLEFLAGFMAACLADCPVFLGNPHWRRSEWQKVLALVQPHLIWDNNAVMASEVKSSQPSRPSDTEKGWIMVPTGGSSGQIRFAIHTWSTLAASVYGCQRHFFGGEGAINSCCWLPLYHVSGLIQYLRSLLTHGQLMILPPSAFESDTNPEPELVAFLDPASPLPQDYFISLVPTQLQRLLQQHPQHHGWLARFHTILLGGAPPWPTLLATARQHHLRLALTYGMTETASQIATLHPDQFLQGHTHNGQVLPHAQIVILDDNHQPLLPTQIGRIALRGASLCKGYYPTQLTHAENFLTDDLGYFNDQGDLTIVGRLSRKIISGGENIFPEEIEAILLGTKMVRDAYVFGQNHLDWGQIVTAVVVPSTAHFTLPNLQAALTDQLSAFKQPKQWIVLQTLPRSPQGKIDHTLLQAAIQDYLSSTAD